MTLAKRKPGDVTEEMLDKSISREAVEKNRMKWIGIRDDTDNYKRLVSGPDLIREFIKDLDQLLSDNSDD